MTPTIIIIFCSLLLIAYLFNITAPKTNIPSVILLLVLGWSLKQLTTFLDFQVPDFSSILPILATIGLVLIVLEGSLELQMNRSKTGLVIKSFLGALLPMLALAFLLSYLFQYFGNYSFRTSMLNAIPLCIISSAIAIPSVVNLMAPDREFVIYESSFSDIIGVLFFNFIAVNESINLNSFGHFGLQLVIMIGVSIIATLGISILLNRIDHHIKFVPLILLVILIYAISKNFHLPALIFILIFGLSIGNLHLFRGFTWVRKLVTDEMELEIEKFKELTIEGAFLIRAVFFILFGFLIETADIINPETFIWSVGIVFVIFILRILQLKISGLALKPLLFVAPRGLITILLFLAILPEDSTTLVNKSLIIQVIVLTAVIMTFGLISNGTDNGEESEMNETEEGTPKENPADVTQSTDP